MTNTLTTYAAAPLATLDSLAEQAHAYAEQSRSANTRRAYHSDWAHFAAWAADRLLAALPAEPATLALYLTDCAATLAVATLTRRLAAISQAHQIAGYSSPAQHEHVRSVMKGIRRAKGTAQRQASAATTPVLKAMIVALPDSKSGLRDRALLLVGFAGALRRSELVSLDVADVQFVSEGAIIRYGALKSIRKAQGAR